MHRLLLTLPLLLLTACAGAPPRTQAPLPTVELARFMGSWYVIANVPYFFERGKVATRDEYRLREDGRIDNDFVFRRGFDKTEQRWNGVSTVVPGSNGARWRVQFVWPFSTGLEVLELDPDYRWALLATPDRKLAWLFSREPEMDTPRYEALRARFQRHGVDPGALQRVPQLPEQVGQPGFQ